jgi:protease I
LEVCGGIFVNEPCVIDGNLVSGRTFHDHGHYIGHWIKLLNEERAKRAGQTKPTVAATAKA